MSIDVEISRGLARGNTGQYESKKLYRAFIHQAYSNSTRTSKDQHSILLAFASPASEAPLKARPFDFLLTSFLRTLFIFPLL